MSGDGRYVTFASTGDDLLGVGGDTNGALDVFVRDRVAATTSRASVGPGGGQANGASTAPAISVDGRYIAFESSATNLVAEADGNGAFDVFVRDRQAGTTQQMSVATGGAQANQASSGATISDDGRYVGFASVATNLVLNDSNSVRDVFLRDRMLATTTRATVRNGGQQAGGGASDRPVISDDGGVIAFISDKTNLVDGDTNGAQDTFAHTRTSVTTERVSVASNQANDDSFESAVSGDGRYVAFNSLATNLVARDTNGLYDIFVRDHLSGAVERVSVTSAGVQANGRSDLPSISADGRYVVFESDATNLVPGDNNATTDVFWHDRQTGVTERVSVAPGQSDPSSFSIDPDVSDDGRYIVFTSGAPLDPADTNPFDDVYRRDRQSGTTTLVSIDHSSGAANASSDDPAISSDGRYVAFSSTAFDLVVNDSNSARDVFRRDMVSNSTVRISVDTFLNQANGPSSDPTISADGDRVAFGSEATNLAGTDTNGRPDVFVRRLSCTGSPCIAPTSRVSIATAGTPGNNASLYPSIDAAGRFVAFQSLATNLVGGDTNQLSDVFVRDLAALRTERVNTSIFLGQPTGGDSALAAISGDGRTVAFSSAATNLVDGDTNGVRDVFLRAQPVPTVTSVSPNAHSSGGVAFAVTVTGTNFLPGAQVNFQPSVITAVATNVTDTTITATFTIPPGTPAGPVDVYVANPGTGPGPGFGAQGRCVGCFTVT
jgi:Tol biopolymer transport system component